MCVSKCINKKVLFNIYNSTYLPHIKYCNICLVKYIYI